MANIPVSAALQMTPKDIGNLGRAATPVRIHLQQFCGISLLLPFKQLSLQRSSGILVFRREDLNNWLHPEHHMSIAHVCLKPARVCLYLAGIPASNPSLFTL